MMHQIELLKKYGLSVRGTRGQHLLVDRNIQEKWIAAIDPKPNETIVEIGPGLGAVTEPLLKSRANVIAIEQDRRFAEILNRELAGDYKNLTLVVSDILKTNLGNFSNRKAKFKVVGNIPYYITAPILLYLISHRKFINSAYLTVQSEVADRIFAQPGSKAYGRLSILMRFYAEVRRLFEISRHCFSPKPRVDSTAIQLVFHSVCPDSFSEIVFFDLVKAGFAKRRKNLVNAIAAGFQTQLTKDEVKKLSAVAKIAPTARAESLMLKDFIRLAEQFTNHLKETGRK
ncbi:MAG: ribosomal RNA small subunit methyltransferase A [Omnitrophica bacterium RIFCSPLOWO2_12_FULL_50_11]|nr:MAG: ribosomal RNA small subunit methyltransferase A [Omnitrophica bacterium RIFCSPLOWO2_12_FULL_50_11]